MDPNPHQRECFLNSQPTGAESTSGHDVRPAVDSHFLSSIGPSQLILAHHLLGLVQLMYIIVEVHMNFQAGHLKTTTD